MLIEVDTGIFFDTELTWNEQSHDCILLGQNLVEETPKTSNIETLDNHSRLISGVWETTTNTGTFDMSVNREYIYLIDSPAYLAKDVQDIVTVTQI